MRRGWGQVLSRDSTLIRLAHPSNRSSPRSRTTTVVCLRRQGCFECWGAGVLGYGVQAANHAAAH